MFAISEVSKVERERGVHELGNSRITAHPAPFDTVDSRQSTRWLLEFEYVVFYVPGINVISCTIANKGGIDGV